MSPRQHTACTIAISAVLLFTFAGPSTAQDGPGLVRAWIASQRDAFRQVQSYSVTEHKQNTIDTGAGKRTYGTIAERSARRVQENSGAIPQFREDRTLLHFSVNGKDVSTDRAARFLMQQRRMLRPDLSRILDMYRFPIQDAGQWETTQALRLVDRNGQQFWRLDGTTRIQSPFGPPGERPLRRRTQSPRFSAWYTTDTFRLHATQIEFPVPGRFSFSIRITYAAEGALDVPQKRTVEGTIPMRRRNRSFAVRFKQITEYKNYNISTN